MRAVVLGAGGQLGFELTAELRKRGVHVLAVTRRQLDITEPSAVEALFHRHQPDWVLNAAAYNLVDKAEREPELAYRVNALGVRNIAVAASGVGATLVHYSTDHVFDGEKQTPYEEEDLPSPPSAYGISKLAGEYYAHAYCDKRFVIRVAGVFGPAGQFTNRSNFPELVLRKARAKEPLRVVEDFFATPTYAVPLAARSVDLLEKAPFGLYHLGGGETVSWYQYALKILEAAQLEADIQPTNHREYVTPARRPRHSSLSNKKIEELGLPPMPTLDEALADYLHRRDTVRSAIETKA
ncbi:MAG: dTDP-4-dehydrorhamnose reductase [Acidobacteria bacterium]|nr:dTDP-4-dehydrorhamnose reductase [Acidobacteriota bacterium]